ncbi:MAG TPA: DNA-binding protein [Nitrososphaerales archaeon]|nr:DNA-binding protein [Nitrososphaerales archaeon]
MSQPPQKPAESDQAERRAVREGVLRMAFSSEARQRLANVRMVKPELAASIEEYVIQLASSGKLRTIIDDEQLKQMLGSLQGRKHETKIRRI